MTEKDELTRREAESWERFLALVDEIPEERRETPALEAGWSVKDVLWHVAFWWNDVIRASREAWREEGVNTDGVNEREQQRSRALPLVEVLAEVDETRRRLLDAWADVDEVTPEAEEYFVEETIDHYEEHAGQLRRFADDPTVKARGD